MKNLTIVTARLFLGFFIIYIFPWSLSKNWRASRDENELDNHAATKTDPDSFRHFLIHCRRCKWMFTGWQVMSLVVDNTDRRNLTPADSPASQQPYTATTHRPVAHTVSWQDAVKPAHPNGNEAWDTRISLVRVRPDFVPTVHLGRQSKMWSNVYCSKRKM